MHAKPVLAGAIWLALGAAGCSAPEVTVIDASCGAPARNFTAAVARSCDGRSRCDFAVDQATAGDPALGCEKDFGVTWRCGGEESVRTALARSGGGAPLSVLLQCDSPAPRRIDVLDAAAGRLPVAGLTAAVVDRCAGRKTCTVTVESLTPLRAVAASADPDLRVHWRCEGEMTWRETRVPRGREERLTCE